MLIRLIIVISAAPWEAHLSDPYHFVEEPSGRFPAGDTWWRIYKA